jgi:hypothetical protein
MLRPISGVEYNLITDIPFKLDSKGQNRIPAILTNPKNDKTIKIDLLPDTGATASTIDAKYARILGLEKPTPKETFAIQSGQLEGFSIAALNIKVGTLKPFITVFLVEGSKGNANLELAIMGQLTFLQFKRVTFTKNSIRFEDYVTAPTTTSNKQSAYAGLYESYYGIPRWNRKRI